MDEAPKTIDYFVHESEVARMERVNKRWFIADGICFEPLAEEFDISVRQCKSIIYKEQDRLFRHL